MEEFRSNPYVNIILSEMFREHKTIKIKKETIIGIDQTEIIALATLINKSYKDNVILINCKNNKESVINIISTLLSNNTLLLINNKIRNSEKRVIINRVEKFMERAVVDINDIKEEGICISLPGRHLNTMDDSNLRMNATKLIKINSNTYGESKIDYISNNRIISNIKRNRTIFELESSSSSLKKISVFKDISFTPMFSLLSSIASRNVDYVHIHACTKDFYFDNHVKDTIVISHHRENINYLKRKFIKPLDNLNFFQKTFLTILSKINQNLLDQQIYSRANKIWDKNIGSTSFISLGEHYNDIIYRMIVDYNLPINIIDMKTTDQEQLRIFRLEDCIEMVPFIKECLVIKTKTNRIVILLHPDKNNEDISKLSVDDLIEECKRLMDRANNSFEEDTFVSTISLSIKPLRKTLSNEIPRGFYKLLSED